VSVYPAPANPRLANASSEVQVNPRPAQRSRPNAEYQQPTSQSQWSPIHIEPIAQRAQTPKVAMVEPTQPMTDYQFKPRTLPASSSASTKASNTQVSNANAATNGDGYYVVRSGDNLYSVARQYNMNLQTLAAMNQLDPPYQIYPKQKLVISSSGNDQSKFTTNQPSPETPMKTATSGPIRWAWPTHGDIIANYESGVVNGIQIAGESGRSIRAAADGYVLYSGNDITGYGEIIVIDHGQGFMSTYAHNKRLLVAQGTQVKRGETIAEMGSSEADRTKLHFEIRRDEKPVNPVEFLPKK